MILIQILFASAWLWVPILLVVIFSRRQKTSPNKLSQQNYQRDQLWQSYLASFREVVKTDKETQLLDTLIAGKSAYEYSNGPLPAAAVAPSQVAGPVPALAESKPSAFMAETARPLDNTILLLYFGAFLLVASVGLFVAIGGLDGIIRTIIVAITAAVLYLGGLWLYRTSKKLAQAGISFVGTGLIVAPLTGVAWYNLVADQTNGGPIWLLTSIVCIALYVHAFSRVKHGFIAYLLIGSFVSSIESAVLTINLPTYGFAWGLIVAALLLTVNNRRRGQIMELGRASEASSRLLIPLSVLGSIALFPQFGSVQLAVSLFLSGTYYALLAVWQGQNRPAFSAAAQVSFIAAAVSAVFSTQKTLVATAITLMVVTALYGVGIVVANRKTIKDHSLVEIAAVTSLLALPLSIEEPWPLVVSLGLATVLATIVWQKLRSVQALQVAALLLIGLPFVIGQYAMAVFLGSWTQLLLGVASALLLGGLAILAARRSALRPYYGTARAYYVLAAALLLIPAVALGFTVLSTVTAAIVLSFALLHYLASDSTWLLCSGVVALVPLADALFRYGIDNWQFSAAVALALAWNMGASLATRQALLRWLVVGCLLITPFAIGGGGLGIHWSYAGYAGGYLLAMASCIAARAIARGKLLLSAKVPIAGYYAEASQAYVTGYGLAGLVAIGVSLLDAHSQLVTSLILGVIALAVLVVAKIERRNQLLALLPLIFQGILFSGLRVDLSDSTAVGFTALVSALAAAGAYAIAGLVAPQTSSTAQSTRLVSVATAYIGPLLVLTPAPPSLLLPVSLLIAGLLTFDYNRSARQAVKELSLGVCIAALQWLLYLIGFTNFHFHSHFLAVCLAGFALWRSVLHDNAASQGYVRALFFVVTVPLVLQSLSGASGGPYGLWLIAEQVGFMVVGVSFGQRFLLRWGLWTALAAVLFQLRGLGWAFLSLLALIIIGVAVYRLNKHPPNNQN